MSMERNKFTADELEQFADKYIDFFKYEFGTSREADCRFFEGDEFARDCEALGFEMDCGESFTQAYGEGWNHVEHLKTIIDKVDDINIIGAGLYSQWRYFNHWSYSNPGEEDKEWFLLLLFRLKWLARPSLPEYGVDITKMRRNSTAIRFANDYVSKAIHPLDEKDLARAFNYGANWGRVSAWNKVRESKPNPLHNNEQIAVVVLMAKNTYDIDVITVAEYDAYINNRKCVGRPLRWAYLRTLLFNKSRKPTPVLKEEDVKKD